MSTEIETLQELLKEEWEDLVYKDSEVNGFVTVDEREQGSGRWTTYVQTITRGPSGKHYSWMWERGLTEYQEDYRNVEDVEEVSPVEKTVITIKWVKVDHEN